MSAVDTKDHLYSLLNGANDVHELTTVCETILIPVLTHTEGFWIEATYCYKASEIAKRAQDAIERYMDAGNHHKTHEMLAKVRDKLRLLVERYHHLQHVQSCC